ncbi:hypothetical protein ARMGADRAFT_1081075 [Armillaria gallica]|uniref:Peptidase C14 n=1 Tax=Armillaria gallica TaxID=47427 RepID=A0A2H3DT73_ARMGA|nr:hypothetical protein ARMGADRAFT_1081075 [Armillaria gallica]
MKHDINDIEMPDLQPPPWVVLIGINGYLSYPLDGCVEDALAMEEYFAKDLAMPNERIQRLLGLKNNDDTSTEASSIPSHRNILSVLHSLINNNEIKHGDPIIIFAARHGFCYPMSDDNDNDNDNDPDHEGGHDCESPPKYVKAFCPIDHDTLDSNDDPVPDISDWELNTILSVLSCAKGHRITVLLDCCYAGSITRTYSGE